MTATTPPHVTRADGDDVVIASPTDDFKNALAQAGYSVTIESGNLVVATADDDAKAALFAEIRKAGGAFAVGREWSPAEIFELLRDKGLLSGAFTEIGWRGPGSWFTRTNG